MPTTPTDPTTGGTNVPFDAPAELEDVLEEVVDTLQPDRAHHDELGRTADPSEACDSSPREQPAEPIDVAKVDE